MRCVVLLFTAFSLVAGAADSDVVRLDFYPTELYLGEPASFGIAGPKGTKVTISRDDHSLFKGTIGNVLLEAPVTVNQAGQLTITGGNRSFTFQLVAPTTKTRLTLNNGYLYAGEYPAILVLNHKHPPKHNRTWEALNILNKISSRPDLPDVESVHLVGGDTEMAQAFKQAGTSRVTQDHLSQVPNYSIDVIITRYATWSPHDMRFIVLTDRDLTLGLPARRLRMRLEWLLQACGKNDHVFVTVFSKVPGNKQRHGALTQQIGLAAESNGATFLSLPPPQQVDNLTEYILSLIQRRVTLK